MMMNRSLLAVSFLFATGMLHAQDGYPAPTAAKPPAEAKPAAPTGPIPRMPDGKPDFQGFWNIPYTPNLATNTPEKDIPYTPKGLAAFKNHDSKDDPTSLCNYPGVPRIMQSPYPVQFLQTPEYLIMVFEYMSMARAIPIGKPHPEIVDDSFMGNSVARWEGDTLIVDTIGLNDKTWLDTAGHQHSDQLHVIERFTRTPTTIIMNYDVIDPEMYSKIWNLERPLTPLKLVPGRPELLEYACNENNKDVQHLISTKPAADK